MMSLLLMNGLASPSLTEFIKLGSNNEYKWMSLINQLFSV